MNLIDFNQSGGFPLSTQILAAQQEAYRIFNQLGYLAGDDLVILTGCKVGYGDALTDGYVHINGEVIPFLGAAITDKVVIVEIPDERGFEDGSAKKVIYQRYATFGSGGTEYTWANFRRPLTLFQLEDRLIKVEKSFPIGTVVVWGKFLEDIPEGFLAWDIAKGCVLVSRNAGDVNFGAALGTKIGVAQVTLDITQIPAHVHKQYWTIGSGGASGNNGSLVDGQRDTTSAGGGQSHTNIQPSLIVAHMIFVGFN